MRIYYGSGTVDGSTCWQLANAVRLGLLCVGRTLRMHSPDGSIFFCVMTDRRLESATSNQKVGLRQSMRIYVMRFLPSFTPIRFEAMEP